VLLIIYRGWTGPRPCLLLSTRRSRVGSAPHPPLLHARGRRRVGEVAVPLAWPASSAALPGITWRPLSAAPLPSDALSLGPSGPNGSSATLAIETVASGRDTPFSPSLRWLSPVHRGFGIRRGEEGFASSWCGVCSSALSTPELVSYSGELISKSISDPELLSDEFDFTSSLDGIDCDGGSA
jgi:hypothetical protein